MLTAATNASQSSNLIASEAVDFVRGRGDDDAEIGHVGHIISIIHTTFHILFRYR